MIVYHIKVTDDFVGSVILMTKIDNKIKAFFSDKEKLKSLVNDKEFIGKASEGTVTAENYRDEFKKLGLEISEDEAKEVIQISTKLLKMPVEQLADISLIQDFFSFVIENIFLLL